MLNVKVLGTTFIDFKSRFQGKKMYEKDELFVQKALYGVILERGNQCLSQASMRTGLGVKALENAKNSLIEKGLIRKVENQRNRGKLYYSYEINI